MDGVANRREFLRKTGLGDMEHVQRVGAFAHPLVTRYFHSFDFE